MQNEKYSLFSDSLHFLSAACEYSKFPQAAGGSCHDVYERKQP